MYLFIFIFQENDSSAQRVGLICLAKMDIGFAMEFVRNLLPRVDDLEESLLCAVFESLKIFASSSLQVSEKVN